MVDVAKKGLAEQREDFHKIRITLTSTNVRSVEKVTSDLLEKAKAKGVENISGPVRLPTKRLRITTRKSPCGEGTNTWDRWQMRIHKRLLDIQATQHLVREITKIHIPAGVEVEVAFVNYEG